MFKYNGVPGYFPAISSPNKAQISSTLWHLLQVQLLKRFLALTNCYTCKRKAFSDSVPSFQLALPFVKWNANWRTKKQGRTNWLVPCPFLILKGKIVSWFVFITNGTEFNFPNRTAYKFFGNPVKLRINNTKIMVLKWRDLLMSWAVRGNWNTSTSYHSELEVWLEKVYPHWKIASYKEHICTNVRIVYRWFWVECEHVNIH